MADTKCYWERQHEGTDRWEVVSPNFPSVLEAAKWRDSHPLFRMDNSLQLVAIVPAKNQEREAG